MEISWTLSDISSFPKMVASGYSNIPASVIALLMWDVKVEPPLGVPQHEVELHLLGWKIWSSISFAC